METWNQSVIPPSLNFASWSFPYKGEPAGCLVSLSFLLPMMSGFLSKLVAAAVALLLLVGGFQATSALLPDDGEKILCQVPGFRSGSRKTVPGKNGGFGGESLDNHGKKIVPFRSLRSSIPWTPPAPAINRRTSYGSHAPPPQNF
ncbi:hypothetical protein L1049_027770 [Liquidambar formosana]|uniref:Uncharacterized protein n=1 Tax=Liquidambar formosana TaxID=63359 RepID=A0AAP0RIQ3_LIQFO